MIEESPIIFYQTLCIFVLSITILVIGVILFYFKPKLRRIIGSVMFTLGILELLIYSTISYSGSAVTFLFNVLTILLGFVFVLFSIEKVAKSKFWS